MSEAEAGWWRRKVTGHLGGVSFTKASEAFQKQRTKQAGSGQLPARGGKIGPHILAGVLRDNTIRGNTTRNSERKLAL